jgi:hypothetical protein
VRPVVDNHSFSEDGRIWTIRPLSSSWGCLALATFELVGLFVGFGLSTNIADLVGGDKTTNWLRFWLLSFAVFTGIGVWLGMRVWKKGKVI